MNVQRKVKQPVHLTSVFPTATMYDAQSKVTKQTNQIQIRMFLKNIKNPITS